MHSILDEGLARSSYTSSDGHLLTAELSVPCRKCPDCLRARARLWRERVAAEIDVSRRSWFGTLTFRPEVQHAALLTAQRRSERSGVQWDTLNESEMFRAVHQVLSPEITRWLKRLRKGLRVRYSGDGRLLDPWEPVKARYCVVAEAHKSGKPHYHLVVHEVDAAITKLRLEQTWKAGFSQFKLIERTPGRVANYVTKYLMKSSLARVRASLDYGEHALKLRQALSDAVTRNDPPNGSEF